MYCPACKSDIDRDEIVCHNCNKKLKYEEYKCINLTNQELYARNRLTRVGKSFEGFSITS